MIRDWMGADGARPAATPRPAVTVMTVMIDAMYVERTHW